MQAAVSFRQLQVFVAVARGGTLARAAEQLSLSQSASSGSLAELEILWHSTTGNRHFRSIR
ncbi:hypothetical protein AO729_18915 [Pseudomonas sp. TTU2014-066ASC]|nr:hypothetical protein AO729_18915 [Pseudomonas sp. TTU2014-066ASC]